MESNLQISERALRWAGSQPASQPALHKKHRLSEWCKKQRKTNTTQLWPRWLRFLHPRQPRQRPERRPAAAAAAAAASCGGRMQNLCLLSILQYTFNHIWLWVYCTLHPSSTPAPAAYCWILHCCHRWAYVCCCCLFAFSILCLKLFVIMKRGFQFKK